MQWLELLASAVEADPRGKAGVADRLDISRTAVSLVLSGKYQAKTDRIAARVVDIYARVDCPALGEAIPHGACGAHALRAAPINNPREMRHWRQCQACQHKPASTNKQGA